MDISVAICTYNGASRIPEVLDHLKAQVGMTERTWEVLVIDNNSKDETAKVVKQYQGAWIDGVPLRYIFEGQQGKSNAIKKAIEEARGDWVAFLDDDNLPDPQWVTNAVAFAENHPRAGAFGGQVHGLFDVEPPKTFGLVKSLFAINERVETYCYNTGGRLEFGAPGAGLVVRRRAWLEAVPPSGLQRKGPTGDHRGTLGEEFELQWRLHQQGWEIWHNASMKMQHKIPVSRFTSEYLEKFFRAIGLSRYHMRMMRTWPGLRPFAISAYWIADLAKLTRLAWVYRTRVFDDPFVRGRALMLWTMLRRPFI